jgi:hypothetical protein
MEALCLSSSVCDLLSDGDNPANLQSKTGLLNLLCDGSKMTEFGLHASDVEFDRQNEV